ncbi:MAG: site-specific integrase [Pseudodesulfovibrio sp.]|nr:site-specific integrase [Pseudodesulfovibrio sp.]
MKSTILADDLALRTFAGRLPEGHRTPLHHIRPRHGDHYISHCSKRGLQPASVVNHYRHLHTAFNIAMAWDYIDENPFSKVQPPRIYKKPPQYIPLEECAAFVNGIEDHDKRMLITAYLATGRRRCELLDLEWENINWDRSEYTVHVTKIHRDLVFPINDLFHEVLVEQCIFWGQHDLVFPRWKNPDSVTHWVKQELTKAGYGDLHLHNFRHSFACGFVLNDGDIYVLMKLLGHSNVSTTMIYADVSRDKLAVEVNRIRFGPMQ